MKIKPILFLLIFISQAGWCQDINLIPQPKYLKVQEGSFSINKNTSIFSSSIAQKSSEIFQKLIQSQLGFQLKKESTQVQKNQISFIDKPQLGAEAYQLSIREDSIQVNASTTKGYFYAMQSLFQLLGPLSYASPLRELEELRLPACIIKDQPQFPYRGIMLDVSRHFIPKDDVKKLIDLMSIYKLNRLHWHLTDDQGWRIEIKQYPKLTEVGAFRKESMKGHYSNMEYDGKPHGGFYSQEDIKEVVAYASQRQVTIVPEIEMPGHAVAALASYPEYGCSGGPYEVRTEWGVATDVFCPYEKTFTFLENILSEVTQLFPSEYIHIGGDECPKDSWKESEFCQNLIKNEGLKDEHGLQSYFIKRIDAFLTSKGRKLIGWDEILEGGLSPNATVMSWRGIAGGIQAAKEGHEVIMSPNSHLYLDYYQGPPENEPLAIGGNLPLEKVYEYKPYPMELNEEQKKRIVGVQGNLWTEYIPNYAQVEYMLFPRALALAEIAWTGSKKKNYQEFVKRVIKHFQLLDQKNVNYATSLYAIKKERVSKKDNGLQVFLSTPIPNTTIKYTIDGSQPTAASTTYESFGITIRNDAVIKAQLLSEYNEPLGNVFSQEVTVNKLTGLEGKRSFKTTKYTGSSPNALSDGVQGSKNDLEEWLGIQGEDLDIVFELNSTTKLNELKTQFLHAPSSWIMLPGTLKVYGSKNGKNYKLLGERKIQKELNQETRLEKVKVNLKNKKVKYLRVKAEFYGSLPASHPGAGKPSWLFIDELILN